MAERPVEGGSATGPGNLTPANVEGSWQASGPSRAIVLLIPDAFLSRVISEHWEADPRNVEIIPQFLSHDPVIHAPPPHLALPAQSGPPPAGLHPERACE